MFDTRHVIVYWGKPHKNNVVFLNIT